MSELKPCPFCGCNAGVLEHEQLNGPTLYKIVCNSKKCRGHDHAGNVGAWLENGWRESREIAAQIWNRRAERTCEIESWYDSDELEKAQENVACTPEDTFAYRCTACGGAFRYDRFVKPKYCPECGSKVERK